MANKGQGYESSWVLPVGEGGWVGVLSVSKTEHDVLACYSQVY